MVSLELKEILGLVFRILCVNGGQVHKVGERLGELNEAVIDVEFEPYPEAKALGLPELAALKGSLRTNARVAEHIGGSQGFVRDALGAAVGGP